MAVKASTTSSNPFAQSVTELLGASLGRAPSGVRDTQSAQDHPSPWGHVPGLVPQPQHPLFLGYSGIKPFLWVFLGPQAIYVALIMGSIRNIHGMGNNN